MRDAIRWFKCKLKPPKNKSKTSTSKKNTRVQQGQTQPNLDPKASKHTATFIDDENYVSVDAGQFSDNFLSEGEEVETPDQQDRAAKEGELAASQSTLNRSQHSEVSPGNQTSGNSSELSSESSEARESSPEIKKAQCGDNVNRERRKRNETNGDHPMPGPSGSKRMEESIQLMQNYMVEKGLINDDMDQDDIMQMIKADRGERNVNDNDAVHVCPSERNPGRKIIPDIEDKQVGVNCVSPSETTVYKNAIDVADVRNMSGSSDEFNNVSDDSVEKGRSRCNSLSKVNDLSIHAGSDDRLHGRERSRSHRDSSRERSRSHGPRYDERERQHYDRISYREEDHGNRGAEEHADRVVREAENSRARMIEITGNDDKTGQALLHSVIVDDGYLQVAAHVEEGLRRRIENFEYIEFSKLLPRDKIMEEEDHRLTFVNKGGVPYLVPASDKSDSQINSYGKWNRAFQVFSEIITRKYPEKAQELLQYDHVIHTAAQTFQWDNVAAYDKDFRIHISRHPARTWSVILQQAWSMRLNDKIHDFSTSPTRSGENGTNKS